jgi:quinol monooxygenase YgiN
MSTIFMATLVVKNGKESEFEHAAKRLSELSHADEPDALVCDVIKSRSKPRTYVMYGRLKDDAPFQIHRTNAIQRQLVPPLMARLVTDLDLHMLDSKN